MKKIVLMAVAACMVVSANAQNPDAVKKVMDAKDFKEAKSLVESSLSSMNDEERAKSWNKVVDLALAKFDKEQTVQITNQPYRLLSSVRSMTSCLTKRVR